MSELSRGILILGASYLGGFDVLWHNLPRDARLCCDLV